jgi:hypothetical protein
MTDPSCYDRAEEAGSISLKRKVCSRFRRSIDLIDDRLLKAVSARPFQDHLGFAITVDGRRPGNGE